MKGMSTRPEEVARRKERFVQAYAETGDATAAALACGYSQSNAHQQGAIFLRDPTLSVRARELRAAKAKEQGDDFVRQQAKLRFAADGAIKALEEIAGGPEADAEGKINLKWANGAQARVMAAVAILDRAGHKPVERVEQRVEFTDVQRELAEIDWEAQVRRVHAVQ